MAQEKVVKRCFEPFDRFFKLFLELVRLHKIQIDHFQVSLSSQALRVPHEDYHPSLYRLINYQSDYLLTKVHSVLDCLCRLLHLSLSRFDLCIYPYVSEMSECCCRRSKERKKDVAATFIESDSVVNCWHLGCSGRD